MSLANKVVQFDADSDLVNDWVHGPAIGTGSTITTDSGVVPTPAKLMKDKGDLIDTVVGAIGGLPFGYQHSNTISFSTTLEDNTNVISGGPLTVANGVIITIPSSSVWSIV